MPAKVTCVPTSDKRKSLSDTNTEKSKAAGDEAPGKDLMVRMYLCVCIHKHTHIHAHVHA